MFDSKRVRWLAAAAAAAAVVLAAGIWSGRGGATATAAEVFRQGIAAVANLQTVYVKLSMRTEPYNNFQFVSPDLPLDTIEMWKEFGPVSKWRAEKSGRVVVMDGKESVLLVKPFPGHPGGLAAKGRPDTGYLGFIGDLMDVDQMLASELKRAQWQGANVQLAQETGTDGAAKLVVTVQGKPEQLTDALHQSNPDWLKCREIASDDSRRVFRFDAASKRLEDLKVYVQTSAGEVLVLEVQEIGYNRPLPEKLFTLDLPKDVRWYSEPQVLPNNEVYARMSAKEATQAFLKACAERNWDEAEKFYSSALLTDEARSELGGLTVLKLGEPFKRGDYPGCFVPFEIRFASGKTQSSNLSIRNDNPANRWMVEYFGGQP